MTDDLVNHLTTYFHQRSTFLAQLVQADLVTLPQFSVPHPVLSQDTVNPNGMNQNTMGHAATVPANLNHPHAHSAS